MKLDWNEVIELTPKGYVELNDGKTATHGPLESIRINDEDWVEIRLKWRAQVPLGGPAGLPQGNWKVAPNDEPIMFPNLVIPFVIEPTPFKGPRVRFGTTNILYIEPIEGLDPSQVEGLKLPHS
jgi:hypothetical protein